MCSKQQQHNTPSSRQTSYKGRQIHTPEAASLSVPRPPGIPHPHVQEKISTACRPVQSVWPR